MTDMTFKPNPHEVARILDGYPIKKVRFILAFVSSLITRLGDGNLKDCDWCSIADGLGILEEVMQIVETFNVPEEEFWKMYGDKRVK